MTAPISCPNCEQPVDPQARFCEHCGVDLAVAALIAERQVKLPISPPVNLPIVPEILVPRLGDYLLEKGIITQVELDHALELQKQKADSGTPILLGQILRELGLVSSEILDQVITEQIYQLQTALRQSNRLLEQRVEDRTRDLQHALEKLGELNQLKANFIANISHELRTPLTHIKGYLDILMEGGFGPLSDPQRSALEILQKSELRLEKLIEDLIQFSLISRGELSLTREPVALDSIVRRAVDASMYRARSAEVILKADIPLDLPMVSCDEEKIEWVITQFIDNALKFTLKGGKVEIKLSQNGDQVVLMVADTGIGIAGDQLSEIFDAFHQLDGSATRHYGGTGLGLALCYRIVEAHASTINVKSQVGVGTEFSFALPIAAQLLTDSLV